MRLLHGLEARLRAGDTVDVFTPLQRGFATRWMERYAREQPDSTLEETFVAFGAYMWNEGELRGRQAMNRIKKEGG